MSFLLWNGIKSGGKCQGRRGGEGKRGGKEGKRGGKEGKRGGKKGREGGREGGREENNRSLIPSLSNEVKNNFFVQMWLRLCPGRLILTQAKVSNEELEKSGKNSLGFISNDRQQICINIVSTISGHFPPFLSQMYQSFQVTFRPFCDQFPASEHFRVESTGRGGRNVSIRKVLIVSSV